MTKSEASRLVDVACLCAVLLLHSGGCGSEADASSSSADAGDAAEAADGAPNGSGGAGGEIPDGGGSCAQCAQAQCSGTASACAGNYACGAIRTCVEESGCGWNDSTCTDDCIKRNPDGRTTFTAWFDCVGMHCTGDCVP